MDRLFTIITRTNSVLLLLVLIGAGVSLVSMSWPRDGSKRRGAIEVSEQGERSPVILQLERIEKIRGAGTQMLLLSERTRPGKLSSGSEYAPKTRNALFLSGPEKKARWLFPKQSNVILTTAQLQDADEPKTKPTRALYFEYVAADTDGDGKLTDQDHSTVALAKPDGTGIVEVLSSVSRVISYDLPSEKQLSVVYQIGPVVRHALITIPSFAKESDQEIVRVSTSP